MDEGDGRRLRGDRSRAQILAHATVLASAEGLAGLSMGRVAMASGVGKGNIQILFGDKEALQLATLEQAVARFQAEVVAPALGATSPAARLLALVEGWYDFVERRSLPGGCFIHAVSSEYRVRPGRIRDRINEHRAATRARLRALILEAKAAGEFDPDLDGDQLVFELLAHQAMANVAALMGDPEEFARARRTSRERIRAAGRPRPGPAQSPSNWHRA